MRTAAARYEIEKRISETAAARARTRIGIFGVALRIDLSALLHTFKHLRVFGVCRVKTARLADMRQRDGLVSEVVIGDRADKIPLSVAFADGSKLSASR